MFSLLQRVFLVIVLGILLIVIGSGAENAWTCLIGALIFAASLLWGGLFLASENLALRITMLAIAGLAIIALISSGGIFSSIYPF